MQKLAVKVLLLVLINCCFSFAKAAKVDTVFNLQCLHEKANQGSSNTARYL